MSAGRMDSEGVLEGLCAVGRVNFHTVKNFFNKLFTSENTYEFLVEPIIFNLNLEFL